MGKTFSEIENEPMALPVNERATLARDLIESLDAESSATNWGQTTII